MPEIIVVTGPTATGKTELAVRLALKIGGEVVNADSMQVYRGMDIGTAKPTAEEQNGIPHHMFGIVPITETFSVSRYVEQADSVIGDIKSRGRMPIITGGTLLYIDSLINGRRFADTDTNLRDYLSGLPDLHRKLADADPVAAAKLHPNDKIRIIRALEVFYLTGKTIDEHNRLTKRSAPKYNAAVIALNFSDRAILYDRINKRVDAMIAKGLVNEVRRLNCATNAIGYKEIAAALRGECSIDDAVNKVKQASRNYAKRQLTWLRQAEYVNWITWRGLIDMDYGLVRSLEIIGSAPGESK